MFKLENGSARVATLLAWLTVASMILSSGSAPAQNAPAPTNRPAVPRHPNVIWIVADSLGYGDLGCYGQTKIKTPCLDQLAAEGVRFTACYAGSPNGAASRASLLTGKHTGHSHVRGGPGESLQEDDLTIAQVLNHAGYLTWAFGEWGLGGDATPGAPGKKGFDEWFGYLEATNADDYYPAVLNRFSRARLATGPEKEVSIPENLDHRHGKYSDDFFTEAALNCFQNFQPQAWTHYKPFFLFLPYTIARANLALAAATGNGMEIPEDDHPYSGENWPQPEKNKAAMISRLDRYVGAIRGELNKLKIDNTIIIFTSAGGPPKAGGVDPKFFRSAGPFRGVRGDLYDGGIRVPLIVWWDRRFRPGTVSEVPCAVWDLPLTTADLAGVTGMPGADGISLKPELFGEGQANRHATLYWEAGEGGFKQALRMGDWKGVRLAGGSPLQVYDLKTDPEEKTDVAGQHPKIAARLNELMAVAREPAGGHAAAVSK